jgi:hypothetical protein
MEPHMEFFDTLGAYVGRRWKACNYDEHAFPTIAKEALDKFPPHANVTLWDVVRWATTAEILPHQVDIEAQFGDPPLTVYEGRGFRIEVLFWITGVPEIHEHGFCGAFHVMQGSSIHTLWNFAPERRIEARLLAGKIELTEAEILLCGDTRVIHAGKRMYHATFHLDRPSISVVVRTLSDIDELPQYGLMRPSLARTPFSPVRSLQRQVQVLQMLVRSGNRSLFMEIARHLMATRDLLSIFEILLRMYRLVEDEAERQELLTLARARDSAFVDTLEAVLSQDEVTQKLRSIHRTLTEPELRFFVALLLNVPDGSAIQQLIRDRYPAREPVTAIVDWLRQICAMRALGLRFQVSWIDLVEEMLRASSTEEACSRFMARQAERGTNHSRQDVELLAAEIRRSWLLRPLFQRAPLLSSKGAVPALQARRVASPL